MHPRLFRSNGTPLTYLDLTHASEYFVSFDSMIDQGGPEDPGVRAEVVRALRRWVIRVETHEAHLERRMQG